MHIIIDAPAFMLAFATNLRIPLLSSIFLSFPSVAMDGLQPVLFFKQALGSTPRLLARIFFLSWPLTIPAGMYLCRHYAFAFKAQIFRALSPAYLRSYDIFRWLRTSIAPSRVRHYAPEEEDKYWREAAQYRRILEPSDANAQRAVPLVEYYAPKMLPGYRTRVPEDAEASEYHLPAKAFCKWHRMVFRGPLHPTLRQAGKLIQNYSSRDRRQMHRIARMQTDAQVFLRTASWTPRFRDMWREWLDTKGADITIVFA